jgi:hypothetical protein
MADEQQGENKVTWRIDRRIPVWGIIAGLIQGLVWGAILYSTLYTSQMNLERRIALLESNSVSNVNFAHLDEKMNGMQNALIDLKNDLSSMKTDVQRLTIRGPR